MACLPMVLASMLTSSRVPERCVGLAMVVVLHSCRAAEASTNSTEEGWLEHGQVELAVGPYDLDGKGWDAYEGRSLVSLGLVAIESQQVFGVETILQHARIEPVRPDDPMGPTASTDTVDVLEIRAGVRGVWRPYERLQLYLGTGPRVGLAYTEYPGQYMLLSQRAASLGWYAHGGVQVRFADDWWAGIVVQASPGSGYTLGGETRDDEVVGVQLALRWDW